MAKRPKDQPQAKYTLSDLRISKVSLVDKPAVPGSVFVIAKARDEEPVEVKLADRPAAENESRLTFPANHQITELCKSIGALCERVDKLLESVATVPVLVPEREIIEENNKPVVKQASKPDRMKPYAKVLNGLERRVQKTQTTINNVTGELPPEEE